MKIINRNTFLALPAGVVFSKYEPCIFGPLVIKGDTTPFNDFYYQEIDGAIDCRDSGEFSDNCFLMQNGSSVSVNLETEGRDGLYDDDQLFAVWEAADLASLIERLQQCVGAT
jgi:hypothetical protein